MLSRETLDQILDTLPRLRIVVVGDLFLDKYLDLDASLTETSIETGLPAYQVTRLRCYPGAAGTVINNLRALGVGKVIACSVLGDDGEAFDLRKSLAAIDVDTSAVEVSGNWMTPTYTKPMLSQSSGLPTELNRLDHRNRHPLSNEMQMRVVNQLRRLVREVDAVIIADQVVEADWGVITGTVRQALNELAAAYPQVVFFADSRARIGEFRGVMAKPNGMELRGAVGDAGNPAEAAAGSAPEFAIAARQAAALMQMTRGTVFATMGANGIAVATASGVEHVPGIPVPDPIDIVGAGDSTTAGIVCGLCCGATPAVAARLGCLVASLTIQQIGVTGTASPEMVRKRFEETAGC